MIRGQGADAHQIIAKGFVAKEDMGGENPKNDIRGAMHHERHHKCFQVGEVIGHDNAAPHVQLISEPMEPYADIKAAFQTLEHKDGKGVIAGVNRW